MADIVLTIPDDQMGRAVDALCAAGGYSGDPNDQTTRRAFAREVIVRFVRQTVTNREGQQAMAAAMQAVTVDPITID